MKQSDWKKHVGRATAVALAVLMGLSLTPPVDASGNSGRPSAYELTGDEGGSKFEGIGIDRHERTFYVSEVTGGEIHRGDVRLEIPVRVGSDRAAR